MKGYWIGATLCLVSPISLIVIAIFDLSLGWLSVTIGLLILGGLMQFASLSDMSPRL